LCFFASSFLPDIRGFVFRGESPPLDFLTLYIVRLFFLPLFGCYMELRLVFFYFARLPGLVCLFVDIEASIADGAEKLFYNFSLSRNYYRHWEDYRWGIGSDGFGFLSFYFRLRENWHKLESGLTNYVREISNSFVLQFAILGLASFFGRRNFCYLLLGICVYLFSVCI